MPDAKTRFSSFSLHNTLALAVSNPIHLYVCGQIGFVLAPYVLDRQSVLLDFFGPCPTASCLILHIPISFSYELDLFSPKNNWCQHNLLNMARLLTILLLSKKITRDKKPHVIFYFFHSSCPGKGFSSFSSCINDIKVSKSVSRHLS